MENLKWLVDAWAEVKLTDSFTSHFGDKMSTLVKSTPCIFEGVNVRGKETNNDCAISTIQTYDRDH